VPLTLIEQSLLAVDTSMFSEVQAALLQLILLFTFSRSESPCPKALQGENGFDPNQHLMVKDIQLRTVPSLHLAVRLKAIKQDQRMERPEAAGNQDWVLIGDVPNTPFSVVSAITAVFRHHGGARSPDAPFFTDGPGGVRPLTYAAATRDVRHLWARASSKATADGYGLHGLRVAGYTHGKRGALGEELAVAQGGWRSTAHLRYDRFTTAEVLQLSTQISSQVRDGAPANILQPGPNLAPAIPPHLPHAPAIAVWAPPPPLPAEREIVRVSAARRGLLRAPSTAAAPAEAGGHQLALRMAVPRAAPARPVPPRVRHSVFSRDFTGQCGRPACTVASINGAHLGTCSDVVLPPGKRRRGAALPGD
jgi:hypothetical protein